jgi:hypothetical protein
MMNLKERIRRILREELEFCDEIVIYFAHPINTYSTEYEEQSLMSIKEKFPNSHIINPGDDFYQEQFNKYRENNPKDYMPYFKDLVNQCSAVVYLPFRDGKVGAGVRYEIFQLNNRYDNIYEINPEDFSINKVSMKYVDENTLSIDETRKRIKDNY